jgi:hypothetical protein
LDGLGKAAAFLLLVAMVLQAQQTKSGESAATSTGYWQLIHRRDDRDFAQSTKLSLTEVQELRRAAGVEDSTPDVEIERMWPIHSTDRYLVTTVAGEAECMKLGVYEKTKGEFRTIWSVDSLPDGEKLCGDIFCPRPWVTMTKDAGIRIDASSRGKNSESSACSVAIHLTYSPTGHNYELSENRREARKCDVWTYEQSLGEAFGATPGNSDRILTIEIVPSFHNEWAIAFEKSPNGITVSKISFDNHLWTKLTPGAPGAPRTMKACSWIAKDSPTKKEVVPVKQEKISKFLDDLAKVDLQMDRCSRNQKGNCVYMMDGIEYYVILPNRRPRRISGWRDSSSAKSENPALSTWVYQVLGAIEAN